MFVYFLSVWHQKVCFLVFPTYSCGWIDIGWRRDCISFDGLGLVLAGKGPMGF